MKTTLACWFIMTLVVSSHAQNLTVVNDQGIPLSFAEFVDARGNVIFYSDYYGRVSLPENIPDSLTVQQAGYKSLSFEKSFLLTQDSIVLTALPMVLDEIIITAAGKGKSKLIHNVKGKENAISLRTNTKGTTILTSVEFKRHKYNHLQSLEIKVDRTDLQVDHYFFKPRFYKVQSDTLENFDPSGLENLLPSAQVVKMKKDDGNYLVINVSQLTIELEEAQRYLVGFTLFSEKGEAMIYSDGSCDPSSLSFIQGSPSSNWFPVQCALQIGFEVAEN